MEYSLTIKYIKIKNLLINVQNIESKLKVWENYKFINL